MEYIGIDVHKRDSQVCVITRKGEALEQRIRTERKSFQERAPIFPQLGEEGLQVLAHDLVKDTLLKAVG